ncbi:response regulator [Hyalangium sp.]|uniref:response regulator n=1 Tax=Hyalangium sp. TaxID=2028555 RepID=UPI002D3770ED|nr:response regulator [Hyalangium sp.]HYH98186.1 response regulator [Hyalangium sp.]
MSILDLFEEEDTTARRRGEHILVVDDERDVREGLGRLLSLEGYEVTTAENGLVALERAKSRRFDLVLTDLRMPLMGGVETLMGLKQLHPGMPVIVVTAYASDETATRCMGEGAYGYVMKPFELDHLLRVIREAVPTGKAALQEAS